MTQISDSSRLKINLIICIKKLCCLEGEKSDVRIQYLLSVHQMTWFSDSITQRTSLYHQIWVGAPSPGCRALGPSCQQRPLPAQSLYLTRLFWTFFLQMALFFSKGPGQPLGSILKLPPQILQWFGEQKRIRWEGCVCCFPFVSVCLERSLKRVSNLTERNIFS